MRARDLFGVAIRVLGVWFLSQNLYWFLWGAIKARGASFGNPNVSPHEDMAYGIIYLILGLILLVCADPIVWVLYGWPKKAATDNLADEPSPDAKSD